MMTKSEYVARRQTWVEGASALVALCKAVGGAMAEAKSMGADMAKVEKRLHTEFSPVYRSIRQAMKNALSDSMLDPELEDLRRTIDEDETDVTQSFLNEGNTAHLDNPENNYDNRPIGAERARKKIERARRVRLF